MASKRPVSSFAYEYERSPKVVKSVLQNMLSHIRLSCGFQPKVPPLLDNEDASANHIDPTILRFLVLTIFLDSMRFATRRWIFKWPEWHVETFSFIFFFLACFKKISLITSLLAQCPRVGHLIRLGLVFAWISYECSKLDYGEPAVNPVTHSWRKPG